MSLRSSQPSYPIVRLCVASVLLTIATLLAAQLPLLAQQSDADSTIIQPLTPWEFGGFVHGALTLHRAGFSQLPGVPNCCAEFASGSGEGIVGGPLVRYRLDDRFSIDTRLGITLFGDRLREPERTTVIVGTETTEGEFEHQLDVSRFGVTLEPSIQAHLIERLRVGVGVGLEWYPSATFDQREVLVLPENVGTFENNRRIRNESDGNVPDFQSIGVSGILNAGYDLPLNSDRTAWIAPELQFGYGFLDRIADSTWGIDYLRAGVSVRFGSERVAVPRFAPAPPVAEHPVQPPLPLLASLQLSGVRENGQEVNVARLHVEEFISTHMRPLLNYIFFDSASAGLVERYRRLNESEVGRFRVERLHNVPTIPTYHHILNIVGRRLREHPDANLRIVGCNDGQELSGAAATDLSRSRAESVRDYLSTTWNLDTSRLRVEWRNVPETPSNQSVHDGIVENRRVELYSDEWDILAPVVTEDTLRVTDPPTLRMRPSFVSTYPVSRWTIDVSQSDRTIRTFAGDASPPDQRDWSLEEEQHSIPRGDAELHAQLTITDSNGRQRTSRPATLDVEQTTISQKRREKKNDRYIDRYSLILFDFDKSEFNELNDRIAEFIRPRIADSASVNITGHTDRIGPTEHNLQLSRRRAEQTAVELNVDESQVEGLGEAVEVYDNSLPEGRFYSRTVQIVVETPITFD